MRYTYYLTLLPYGIRHLMENIKCPCGDDAILQWYDRYGTNEPTYVMSSKMALAIMYQFIQDNARGIERSSH